MRPTPDNYYLIASNAFGTATSPSLALDDSLRRCGVGCAEPALHELGVRSRGPAGCGGRCGDGDWILATNGLYALAANSSQRSVVHDQSRRLGQSSRPCQHERLCGDHYRGRWHPGTTNGLDSIRCAWLTNGAVLRGHFAQQDRARPIATAMGRGMVRLGNA